MVHDDGCDAIVHSSLGNNLPPAIEGCFWSLSIRSSYASSFPILGFPF